MNAPARHKPRPAEHRPVNGHAPDDSAAPCRRLWSEVVLAAYNDWWTATRRAKGDPARIAELHAKALRYFESRDGREVLALAGITADPQRLADAAVDPDAYKRTILLHDGRADA